MIINGNAKRLALADGSIHCIVTSPPYFGLRDYGASEQIGQEQTVSAYIDNLRECAREWFRVLRHDGSLWLNLGDSYAGSGRGLMGDGSPSDRGSAKQGTNKGTTQGAFKISKACAEYKQKDLYGIPWAVATALRADGWYLRRDIIWAKNNPMPESVTDRPTTAHEYIFLLTKSARYFYDEVAVAEPAITAERIYPSWEKRKESGEPARRDDPALSGYVNKGAGMGGGSTRNLRSVWDIDEDEYAQFLQWKAERSGAMRDVWPISSNGYKGAHFATMPPEIPRKCIMAGTSARGCCPDCGAPFERVTHREKPKSRAVNAQTPNGQTEQGSLKNERVDLYPPTNTEGWYPTCNCSGLPPLPSREEHTEEHARLLERARELTASPCVVLDSFSGSGTTGKVAIELGRQYIGVEINPAYIALAHERTTTTIGMAF